MGRKALDPEKKMKAELRIRLTTAERATLDRAALVRVEGDEIDERGVTSAWARAILLKAAERNLAKNHAKA